MLRETMPSVKTVKPWGFKCLGQEKGTTWSGKMKWQHDWKSLESWDLRRGSFNDIPQFVTGNEVKVPIYPQGTI